MSVEVYRGRSGWRYIANGRDDGDYISEAMARDAGEMFLMNGRARDFDDAERLADCELAGSVPADAGGIAWSEWESTFLVSLRATLTRGGELTPGQKAKLTELHGRT